jgi:hypothetical protein
MAHGSFPHSGGEMSAELSEADQQRAFANFAAEYRQAHRPPLTAAERHERQGNVTLPFTDDMRAAITPLSTLNLLLPYGVLAAFVCMGIVIVSVLLMNDSPVLMVGPAVIAIPLYFVYARWMRARRAAVVNRMQSYDRYSGPCAIKETRIFQSRGADTYSYTVTMASPRPRWETWTLCSGTGSRTKTCAT